MTALAKQVRPALLVSVSLLFAVTGGLAQQPPAPKRVLMMHWYDRDYPANSNFDLQFQAALQTYAPKGIEYYSEYLETNKFPGENQSELLADYLQQKYEGREMDVIVTRASPPLNFLLTHRRELFPRTPIVFASERPVSARAMAEGNATGIVYLNTHARTLELATRLHPQTKQIFIVTGTLTHDKSLEAIARDQLQDFKGVAGIQYLTDLTPAELTVALRDLPGDSIVLYVWQQARDPQGKVMESRELLAAAAREAKVPIYGMSFSNVGYGIVGGYTYTLEGNAAKVAEMTLRVANGARAADIPVERAPEVPMFDWRQLQRFGIREDQLPPGSVIRFRELTFWQQYQGRIVAVIAVFGLQALLIGALLLEGHRSRRTQAELKGYKEHLENLVQERTAELVTARDHALEASRSKTVFLASMSHELRTPLNAILGFSGMVLRDPGLSDQHRQDLTIVGSSGEHLLGLIDDVLDMAKIEAGGVTVESEAFDLHAAVNETVNMLRDRAQPKNLELFLDVSSQAPQFVRTDAGKLRQVLTNLVGNAVKYTDEGSVVVRLDARPGDRSGNTLLIFEIEDTGIGISEEDRARIFDAFVQAATARVRKGVGLGLAISRHFVHLLGGTIQVESTLGKGSRFRVELPVLRAEASEVTHEDSAEGAVAGLEPGQPDYRILIVEDERANWLLLQRLLQPVGFHVRVAEDGAQAVEAFRVWRPHLIWMDVRLPVMGGMEATKRIRKLEGGGHVKIVAVTASAFASQREEVMAAGLDGFLRKPYRPSEIFDCLARLLGVRYIYRAEPQAAAVEPAAPLHTADLAALPAGLREELEHAVVRLDAKRIALLVGRISELNASLGSALERLAAGYAYTQMHDALRNCNTHVAGTSS